MGSWPYPTSRQTYVNPQYCLCYVFHVFSRISMKRIKKYKFKARKSQEAMDTYKENFLFLIPTNLKRKKLSPIL